MRGTWLLGPSSRPLSDSGPSPNMVTPVRRQLLYVTCNREDLVSRWRWRAQRGAGQGRGQWEAFPLSLPDLSSCQVLTIAATEPVSLLHSKPPKPTQARGKLLLLSSPGGPEDSSPDTPGPAPKTNGPVPEAPLASLADPSAEGDLSVDFEKIYKYLSSVSRRCHGPELSAAGENSGQGL